MSTVPTSENGQTPPANEQDYVFNAETCRALRKKGYDAARVYVPLSTILLLGWVAAVLGALTSVSRLDPWISFIAVMAISAVLGVVLVAELRWFDVSLDRETIREAWAEMSRDLRREAREYAGDPKAIEARVLEDTPDPNARPELAFGLPPEDCFVIFAVPVAGLWVVPFAPNFTASVVILGACIALSGTMVPFLKIYGNPSTYPPEDPPHDCQRGNQ